MSNDGQPTPPAQSVPIASSSASPLPQQAALANALSGAARVGLEESVIVEQLKTQIAKLKQERESILAPWWRQARTATMIASILAAIVPATAAIKEYFDSARSSEERRQERVENTQKYYLDRVKETKSKERAIILRFARDTSVDKQLAEWATRELAYVEADIETEKTLARQEAAKRELEERNQEMTRRIRKLEKINSDTARQVIEEAEKYRRELETLQHQQEETAQKLNLPPPTVAPETPLQPEIDSQDNSSSGNAPTHAPPVILWVDDSPNGSRFPRARIEKAGGVIISSSSTADAIERYKKEQRRIDLVITDMARRGDDRAAYTLLEQLKSLGAKVPLIIYADGGGTPEHRKEAQERGATLSTGDSTELLKTIDLLFPPFKSW